MRLKRATLKPEISHKLGLYSQVFCISITHLYSTILLPHRLSFPNANAYELQTWYMDGGQTTTRISHRCRDLKGQCHKVT